MAKKNSLGRRGFLKGAAASAAALATTSPLAEAQQRAGTQAANGTGSAPAPTQAQIDRDAGNVRPPA